MTKPYYPRHFKVHAAIQEHERAIAVYQDDALLAMFVRVGIMAVERYADRNGDSFLCSGRDLERLAGCSGVANARRKLGRLEAEGGPTVGQEGAGYRLTMRNFSKHQGFEKDSGAVKRPSSTSSSTTTTTSPKKQERAPSAPPAARAPSPSKGKVPCPESLDPEAKERLRAWASKRGIDRDRLTYGWQAVRDWAAAGNKRQADWEATFRNALRKGWCLEGYAPPAGAPSLRYRDADDVLAERERKQRADDARRATRSPESPETIGQLIDLSLRQAGGAQ